MATAVTIDEITAPDASSHAAPHKISDKSSKNSLTVKFTPTSAAAIRKWIMRYEATNRNTGRVLGRLGAVCGSGDRCGVATTMPLALPSGTQVTETITYTETGPGSDGDHVVTVYAWANGEASG